MAETNEDKVQRYTECLMNGIDTKRALKRLFDLEVALDAYKTSDTYRFVKRYESVQDVAKYAKRVRDKLREMGLPEARKRERQLEDAGREHDEGASSSTGPKRPKKEVNTDELFAQAMGASSGSSSAAHAPRAVVDYSKYKVTKRTAQPAAEVKKEIKSEPIESSSSQSCSSSQEHHQKTKEYAPALPPTLLKPAQTHHHHHKAHIPMSASLQVDESQFKPRKERQKVFAGRKRRVGEEVPTLLSMCQSVLSSNVQLIDHIGIVPYELMKPAFEVASISELRRLADANPQLTHEMDTLFHDLVRREFAKYADREPDGWTWREMYDKLVARKKKKEDSKLEMLTNRIGKAHTGSKQGRQTMVIDMAHTRVRSKSFFNNAKDTQVKMLNTPSAIQLSQARKHVKTEGKAQLNSITPRGGLGPTRSSKSGSAAGAAPKTAPLMAKVKKMLKR
ncbi:unnamed protein product [Caenorhabditis sp. 36 PRJEB53466]|nr:unnamed protein product [Caenorhabditis sp. 36 PRJEB53466]